MAWNRDGTRRPTCILEAALWHYAVQPVCRCGHKSPFNAHGLWNHFDKHNWSDDFADARLRFWCRVCGARTRRKVRPVTVGVVKMSDADVQLPLPDEREWKRVLSRYRS